MPNAIHIQLDQIAKQLIADHGRDVQFQTMSKSGDAFSPTRAAAATETVKAVEWMVEGSARNTGKYEGGDSLITMTTKRFIVDSAFEPRTGMRVVDGIENFTVKHVDPIEPGETNCGYIVWAHR